MQEQLILKPTTEYNIDNIGLDYTKLSASEEFGEKLEQFNSNYDVNLVATKGARWQPGTYNKLKNWVPNIIYPHWKIKEVQIVFLNYYNKMNGDIVISEID